MRRLLCVLLALDLGILDTNISMTFQERPRIMQQKLLAKLTHNKKHRTQPTQPPQIQRPPAHPPTHQKPRSKHPRHINPILSQRKVITLTRRHARLLQEIRRVPAERVASEVLDRPNHADDFGATQVGAAETVEVGRSFCDFFFEHGRVLHHGDGFVDVEGGFAV